MKRGPGQGRAGGYRKLRCLFFLSPNFHSRPQLKGEIMSEYLLHFMLLITNHTIGRKRETEFSFLHWQNRHIQGSRRREQMLYTMQLLNMDYTFDSNALLIFKQVDKEV